MQFLKFIFDYVRYLFLRLIFCFNLILLYLNPLSVLFYLKKTNKNRGKGFEPIYGHKAGQYKIASVYFFYV